MEFLKTLLASAGELIALGFLGFGFVTAVLAVWALIRYFRISSSGEIAEKTPPTGPYYAYLTFSFAICALGAFLQYQETGNVRDELNEAVRKLQKVKQIEQKCIPGDANTRYQCYETELKKI